MELPVYMFFSFLHTVLRATMGVHALFNPFGKYLLYRLSLLHHQDTDRNGWR